MTGIKLWWYRWFKVITTEQAVSLGLQFKTNIYGDLINHMNCRSVWIDKKGRQYRIDKLKLTS